MALTIRTTGVEDYVTGDGRIKMMVIGGAGVGKTRMSSFWPKPIYADTEGGRGSIADRNVPYVEVKSSQDMLDFLAHLKEQERLPRERRPYQTVVIDTLDGFQRKVIDERLQMTKQQSFSGWADWGYLDSKMQALLTRLLNLDLNVLVLIHYKDKTVGVGDDARTEVALQLKGDIANSVVNDFDLIGRLGTYWEAEGGERVERRGLTFKKTPDWPALKDRFGVLPNWTPISLTSEQDYQFIRDAFKARLEELTAGEVVGEISTAEDEAMVPSANVVAPIGGPLPPQDPREVPLHQFDKPTLSKICRDEGITTTTDGQPIRANTIKAELVQAIEVHRASKKAESDSASASPEPAAAEAVTVADVNIPTPAEVKAVTPSQPEAEQEPDAPATPVEAAPVAETTAAVDTATGEIAPSDPVGDVEQASVAEVPSQPAPVEDTSVPVETAPAPEAPAAKTGPVCEQDGCDVDLTTQSADYVRLSFIRFKKKLCGTHYQEARANAQG